MTHGGSFVGNRHNLRQPMPAVGDVRIIDESGKDDGWQRLVEGDFENVNGEADTWSWKDGVLACTGRPVGVTRFHKPLENFELSLQCGTCHLVGILASFCGRHQSHSLTCPLANCLVVESKYRFWIMHTQSSTRKNLEKRLPGSLLMVMSLRSEHQR